MDNESQRVFTKAWNDTNRNYPTDVTVDEWVLRTTQRSPNAPAVTFEGVTYSYTQLDAASARVASKLEALGLGEECTVGVSMVRSFELCAVLLGILRSGAAYVPLDPTLPADRLRYMVRDSGARVLFVQQQFERPWTDVEPPLVSHDLPAVLRADEVLEASASVVTGPVAGSRNPRRLACVLYTSGSTGAPKGVMIEHASMVNLFFWMSETFGFTERDVFIQNTPFGFDVSLTELFLPLTVGAQVVLARPEGHKDPVYLAQLVQRWGVTVVNFVPSMLRAFIEALEEKAPKSIRALLSMGEPLARDLADAAAAALPDVTLHNLYGLTETTVHATLWTFRQGHQPPNQVLIGRPLANTLLYILDEKQRPVAPGEVGEIYVAGRQLARGYLNRDELTRERFLRNPFESDSTMYKTGDLGRFMEDGNVEFLGRNDFQVKLRGLRIELGEIEHVLSSVDGVRQSAVVLRSDDSRDPHLVAYVRVSEGEGTRRPTVAELQAVVSRALPAYMVPSAFVIMDAFPINQNGKLDRGRLPSPGRSAFCETQFAQPLGMLESLMASEWSNLLGPIGGAIGRNDSFISLGGHSLLAVQFVARMRRQGWEVTLADVFEGKTLACIAECTKRIGPTPNESLSRASRTVDSHLDLVSLSTKELEAVYLAVGGRGNVQDILPVTPFQEGILFHHRTARSGDPYLLSSVLSFASKVQLDAYVEGLQAVVGRHDAFRSCILHKVVSRPIQVVLKNVSVNLERVAVHGETREGAVASLMGRYGASEGSMDIESAPVLRLYVCEWRSEWLLLEVRHHILVDDHSIVLCRREVMAWLRKEFGRLEAPALLRDYVVQAATPSFDQGARSFFRSMLGHILTPTLPYDLELTHGSTPLTMALASTLPAPLSERLTRVALQNGVSAATLFHVGWSLALSRITGQQDVVFGTVLVDRRGVEESEAAAGPFMNTLPIALTPMGPVDDLVRTTQRLLASLLRHVGTRLVDAQGCAGIPKGRPLFSSLLNFRLTTLADLEQEFVEGISCVGEESLATYPIAITIEPLGKGFRLMLRVEASIDAASICELLVHGMELLVGALENKPATLVQDLDVIPAARVNQLVRAFNPSFPPRCYDRVERMFEAVASGAPHSVALSEGGVELTFAELNQRANQIAHWLVRQGVVPGDAVGLVFSRGIDLICLQLAVLKVGGVYVPLDPSYPDGRLWRQIEIASVVLTVVESPVLAERLLGRSSPAKVVVHQPANWHSEPIENVPLTQEGDARNQPAYIMFTSGSTGEPKGVLVTHAGIARLVTDASWLSVSPGDHVTILSNPAFDGSTFEVWLSLLNGATGHVIERDVLFDPRRFSDRLMTAGVTVMLLPTALFHQYGDQLAQAYAKLKYLIVGGERLQAAVVEHVLRKGRPEHLVNAYGPTETSVIATTYEVPSGETLNSSIPIGYPIDQTSVYLLDAQGRLVPPGAVGEIWVSGDGVALGYVNAQESTRERFVLDRFCPDRGRMYRTGDLGRHRPDGAIDYVGRVDNQVKVRGHRVELSEIEATLRQVETVSDAAVVAIAGADTADTRLVAFVCFVNRLGGSGIIAVRQSLEGKLPSFMVPALIVEVANLPLTQNGKVDLKALALQAARTTPETEASDVSETLIERLTQMWSKALGVTRVDAHDDFFELGGHSLLAMTLVEQMRQDLGLNVDVPMLFEHSSPGELLRAASHCE